MSETRGAGREARGARIEAEGARFDAAIDRAAREMLDVEPPPGLRGRVMDRIEVNDPMASAFRRKFWLVAAPVAAAAVIAVAVMAPWRETTTQPAPATPPVIAQTVGPPLAPPALAPTTMEPGATAPRRTVPRTPPPTFMNAARAAAPRADRTVVAAASVAAVEDVNFMAIDALAPPQAIAIERLADPLPSSMRVIEPAPLQIRPIEITALPETPRQRREE